MCWNGRAWRRAAHHNPCGRELAGENRYAVDGHVAFHPLLSALPLSCRYPYSERALSWQERRRVEQDYLAAEAKARLNIDSQLRAAGWIVQNYTRATVNAGKGWSSGSSPWKRRCTLYQCDV